MKDKEFFKMLKNYFSVDHSDREAIINNSIINRLNDIEEKIEVLEILKKSPFVLQKFFELKELKNQDEYNKRYFWGTIDNDAWAKVKGWLEK